AAVLKQRALKGDIEPTLVRWDEQLSVVDVGAAERLLLYQRGAFRDSLEQGGEITVGTRRLSAQQWYGEILRSIEFKTTLSSKAGETRLVTVPVLTGLRQCVA